MPASSQPAPEPPRFTPALDPALVREQLNRLLAHSLFANSKRYPVLLAYVVEQTLLGNAAQLKERTIGVEAFSRTPDYDVNTDPIVRTSAAEVRKRLVQYYYDASHTGQLVIELSAGSYVPAFREPDLPRIAPANLDPANPDPAALDLATTTTAPPSAPIPEPDPLPAAPTLRPAPPPPTVANHTHPAHPHPAFRWLQFAALLLIVLFAGIAIGRHRPSAPASNMQKFWDPITASPGPVTYCIGEPGTAADLRRAQAAALNDPPTAARLSVSDVITLSRSIVPLVPRNIAFRVLSSPETSFAQLREGPNVLIGAFSNLWSLRVTEKLRFGFDINGGNLRLVDRKSPTGAFWQLQHDASGRNITRDYALIARIHDNLTGQPVIIIAGLMGSGTEAAGEVLYNHAYLDALLQQAPEDWDKKNLEAVIQTDVVDDNPGPPTILAVETW